MPPTRELLDEVPAPLRIWLDWAIAGIGDAKALLHAGRLLVERVLLPLGLTLIGLVLAVLLTGLAVPCRVARALVEAVEPRESVRVVLRRLS